MFRIFSHDDFKLFSTCSACWIKVDPSLKALADVRLKKQDSIRMLSLNPSLRDPRRREKIKLNVYFHTSL